MPSNTSLGFPYPLGSDRLMDGDDAIKALADFLNARTGVTAQGQFTSAASGTAGAVVTTAVTFPAGRFTAVPAVVCSSGVTDPTNIFVSANAPTTTGVGIRTVRGGGTAGFPVAWIALQV
jgi:hypothetical protein